MSGVENEASKGVDQTQASAETKPEVKIEQTKETTAEALREAQEKQKKETLEKVANPEVFLKNPDPNILTALKLNIPDLYQDVVDAWGDQALEEAKKNPKRFTEIMIGFNPKEVKDYGDAKDEFEKLLKEKSEKNPNETVQFVVDILTRMTVDRKAYLEKVPGNLQVQVMREYESLLRGRTTPKNELDRALITFLLQDPEDRKRDDTQILRAVQVATVDYQNVYDATYKKRIEDKKGEALTTSRNPSDPNFYDEAARLQALIIMGQEAKTALKNMGIDIKPQTAETAAYKPNLDFIAPTTKPGMRGYTSKAAMHGFNGADIVRGSAQFLAGATVILNALKFNRSEGDWKENFINNLATNTTLHAAALGFMGLQKYKENPDWKNYVTASEGEQQRIVDRGKLSDLENPMIGQGFNIETFVRSEKEWEVILKPELSPDAVKKLLETAVKNKESVQKKEGAKESLDKYPQITAEDLTAVLGPNALPKDFSRSKESAVLRYQFYKKFLQTARNRAQLKENLNA